MLYCIMSVICITVCLVVKVVHTTWWSYTHTRVLYVGLLAKVLRKAAQRHTSKVCFTFVGDIVSVVAVDNDELVSEVGIGSDNACVNVEAHVADPLLVLASSVGWSPDTEFLLVSQVHDFGFRG